MDAALTASSVTSAVSRKRRKQSAEGPSGKNRLTRTSLSALPDLSIDILFSIFSHLLPLDLLRVTRTSKSFRKLLLDRKASTVWIASRERAFPNYPEPPDGMSEPFWANLVFGETVCEKCGNNKIRKVTFEWRCRLCVPCLKESTMKESSILKIWPDSDKSIVDLLPYVHGLFGSSKTTRFYWNEDVIKIGARLEAIHDLVARGIPGAAEDLHLFKQERLALVKAILEHSKECWDASQGKVRNVAELKQKRYQQVFDRFKALGYKERDIKEVLKTIHMRPVLLTEQAWNDIQGQLEPHLLHRRFLNLRESAVSEEPPHLEARRRLITELYDEYCKDLTPIEREPIPPVGIISMFPQFTEVLQQPPNVEVSREHFTRAMANIGPYVYAWDGVIDMCMGGMAGWQTTGPDGDPNKLNLSWFVTICAHPSHQPDGSPGETYRGDVAFSRREALFHLYHDHGALGLEPYSGACAPFETLRFSEAGSTAVRSLIKLAGLREGKAMPLHMDFTRARFVCEHCDPEPRAEGADGSFKPVMDWRQAANHYVDCWRLGRADHPEPAWRMLSELENEAVTEAEHALENMSEYRDDPRTWFWRCNHCKTFEPRSFVAAFLHVKQRHFVFQPRVGRDLYPDGLGVRAYEPAHHIRVDCDPRLAILTQWNGVHKLLEPDQTVLQEAVDKYNATLFRSRRTEMGERYAEWLKKTFTPLELEGMPKARIVQGFPHVLAVTGAPRNKIGSDDYEGTVSKLPEAIEAWRADVDGRLRTLKVESGLTRLMHAILAIMPSLDAAMFVTECSHRAHDVEKADWGDIAFGRGEALAHLLAHTLASEGGLLDSSEPCSVNTGVLSFLSSGSSAVVSLVEMLGLEEDTATPTDMDKAGAAFVCERCEPHQLLPGGDQLRTIFNWRQAAIHVVDRLRFGKVEHLRPSWRLLTARELRALKLAEEKCQLEPSYPLWVRCNRCLDERFDARTEKSMMDHLRSVHDLEEPVLGQDFYYNPLKAGSLIPVHRICVEPAPDAAVRIRSIGQVGTKLSYSELDYRGA